jgi:hypothetical protein
MISMSIQLYKIIIQVSKIKKIRMTNSMQQIMCKKDRYAYSIDQIISTLIIRFHYFNCTSFISMGLVHSIVLQ